MSFVNKINDSSAVNSARQFLNTPAKKAVAIVVVALAVIVLLGVFLIKGCCCCRKPRPTPPSSTPSSARAAARTFGSTTPSTSAATYGLPSSPQQPPADQQFRDPLYSEFSPTSGFDEFIQPSDSSPHRRQETDLPSSIILTRDFLSDPVSQELIEAAPLLPQDETSTIAEPSSSDGINWVLISEGVEEATVLGADGVGVKRLRHANGEEWEKRPLDPKKSKSHGITGSWIRIKDADQKALTATSTEAQVQPAAVLELFAAINKLSEEGGPNDHVTASPVMALAKQLSNSNLARPSTSGQTN